MQNCKSLYFRKCLDPSHRDRGLFLGQRPLFLRVHYFPTTIPLTCYSLLSALRNFASSGKWGKKWPENGKNRPKMAQKWNFGAIVHFSAIFPPICPVRPQSIVQPYSPDFGPKTRKQSVAGQRDRKVSVLFSSRQSDLRNFHKLHLHLGNFLELFFGGIDLIILTLTLLNVFELEM